MNFNKVKQILEKIGFDMDCCSILDSKRVPAGDGVVAYKEDGVFKVFYVERHNPFSIEEYCTEEEASNAFLVKVKKAYGDWYDFSKYIQ